MKIDGGLMGDLAKAGQSAKKLEALGYQGAITAETSHDPFFPLLLAAQETEKIELITSIAVAFSRTPMNLANIGHDLNSFSKGRFVLGLGSQIRPHITKRFSMQWGAPAAQMRELVLAMRAIWANWYDGDPLEFVGKYYRHTLMTPAFTPEDKQHGAPRVVLAAVGPADVEMIPPDAEALLDSVVGAKLAGRLPTPPGYHYMVWDGCALVGSSGVWARCVFSWLSVSLSSINTRIQR